MGFFLYEPGYTIIPLSKWLYIMLARWSGIVLRQHPPWRQCVKNKKCKIQNAQALLLYIQDDRRTRKIHCPFRTLEDNVVVFPFTQDVRASCVLFILLVTATPFLAVLLLSRSVIPLLVVFNLHPVNLAVAYDKYPGVETSDSVTFFNR